MNRLCPKLSEFFLILVVLQLILSTHTCTHTGMSSKITLLTEMEGFSFLDQKLNIDIKTYVCSVQISLSHTHTHTPTCARCAPSCAVLQTSSGIVKSWQLLSACILLLSSSPLLIHHLFLCVSLTLLLSLCET